MYTQSLKITPLTSACMLLVGCVGITYAIWKWKFKYCKLHDGTDLFRHLNIKIVTNSAKCDLVIQELRRRCHLHNAIGFDCEWVSNGGRHPVALLQLSSFDGLCGLFRLNRMKTVPDSLKDLLEDEMLYKVGVAPIDDAQYLFQDYGINMRSTLDLRHIANLCKHDPRGLAGLSKSLLNVELDKNWRIRCSDWEAEKLTDRQIMYAALDAHVSVMILDKLIKKVVANSDSALGLECTEIDLQCKVNEICKRYKDRGFHKVDRVDRKSKQPNNKQERAKKKEVPARKSPLYNNCFLVAPNNETLCTISHKKAHWYAYKGLGDIVNGDPLTVRLRFEPACRQLGEADQYYKIVKENKCVACGNNECYLRKNVVPKDYRKHFPDIMKGHSSHDVVLLCSKCHGASNQRDHVMRLKLATMCDAPLPYGRNNKYTQDDDLRKVRSAARALLNKNAHMPVASRKKLENVLLKNYPDHERVTEEMVKAAAEAQYLVPNENFESHGLKVVDYFANREGGLLRLEEMWRVHFLSSMRPKHMPHGWSVTHNHDRLEYKYREGHMSTEELKLTGFFN